MSEILLLNARRKAKKRRTKKKTAARKRPTRRRRTRKPAARRGAATTKGAYTMARRKRKATRRRRAPRRNPSRRRSSSRRITRRAGGAFAGLNFKTALKNIPISTIGMFAAKWAAKRFGQPASETDPSTWNYASYLKGAGGAAAAGFLVNMIRPGMGQKVLEGGMSLMLYKLVQNELIAGNEFWTGQLGAGEERVPGTVEENSAGEPFILGEDYQWYPLEGADDYRMEPDMPILGEALVQPGPLGFGEALVQPGPLGFGEDLDTVYAGSFLRR